jgi:hypothetical protein
LIPDRDRTAKFIVNGREEDVEWVFLDIDASEFRRYLYEFQGVATPTATGSTIA